MPSNDFRYIGYRVLDVDEPGCTHLLEFAFNTWEQHSGRLVSHIFGVDIDVDGDQEGDHFLFNTGLAQECLVVDAASNGAICTGYVACCLMKTHSLICLSSQLQLDDVSVAGCHLITAQAVPTLLLGRAQKV